MHKSFAVLLFAVVAATATLVTQLNADVIPPAGLAPGSQYQLVFVTAGTRDASSSNIADYNTFVTTEAALSPTLPTGVAWNAIATTSTVNAVANAPSLPGIPVYNTHGDLVASGASGLYAGTLTNAINYDQYGTLFPASVWTGDIINGGSGFLSLGEPDPIYGDSTATIQYPSGWVHYGNTSNNGALLSLYALVLP